MKTRKYIDANKKKGISQLLKQKMHIYWANPDNYASYSKRVISSEYLCMGENYGRKNRREKPEDIIETIDIST